VRRHIIRISQILCILLLCIATPTMSEPAPSVTPAASCPDDQSHLIPRFGGRWFLAGANVPWMQGGFGADFATVEEWGQHTYDPNATRMMFSTMRAQGANTARWWLFADGRGAPEFSASSGGSVTGLDANFLPSLASAIQIAAEEDFYLVFNLWSFDMLMADSTPQSRGEHAGGHRDMIVESSKRASFINNALIPMLRYPVGNYTVGTHPNVLAWDIFNEPEFGIDQPPHFAPANNVTQPVTLAQMQRFVAEVSGAIHANSNQLTTVGSAAMKWNSDHALGAIGNVWSDAQLKPYHPNGHLDFYQIHYYGWMNGDGVNWSYSPLLSSWHQAGFDKPTVIGEFPANAGGTNRTSTQLLRDLHTNCYAGVWAWPYYNISDNTGQWSDVSAAIAALNSTYSAELRITQTNPEQPPEPNPNFKQQLYLPLIRRN
jgi:hypothetical protein